MKFGNNHPGRGGETFSDYAIQTAMNEAKARPRKGVTLEYKCTICGLPRGRGRDHRKCSRILQQRHKARGRDA